jgi:hypothetical protein
VRQSPWRRLLTCRRPIATQDILISTSTIKSLDFHSSFKLRPTKDGQMHAFLAYFDTFFTPSGAAAEGPVSLERFDESLKIDGRPGAKNDVSFTTGVSRRTERCPVATVARVDLAAHLSLHTAQGYPDSLEADGLHSQGANQGHDRCVTLGRLPTSFPPYG